MLKTSIKASTKLQENFQQHFLHITDHDVTDNSDTDMTMPGCFFLFEYYPIKLDKELFKTKNKNLQNKH